jgi:hypothetical protein
MLVHFINRGIFYFVTKPELFNFPPFLKGGLRGDFKAGSRYQGSSVQVSALPIIFLFPDT